MGDNLINNKKRNKEIDILKGVAIILVVLGHCVQYSKGVNYRQAVNYSQSLFFQNKIFVIIYSFHMPFFMLISGYLFCFSLNKYGTKQLVYSKFKTLIIPIISWTFLFTLLVTMVTWKVPNIKSFIRSILGSLWFLWAVFYCTIGVIICNRLFKDNILFHVIILLMLMLLPNVFNKDLYTYMYPYFLIGYYVNKHKIDIKKFKGSIIFLVYCIMVLFWKTEYYIYTTGISLFKSDNILKHLEIDMYRWIIGLLGSIAIIWIINKIYDKFYNEKFAQIITYIGVNSLGIYILAGYIAGYVLIKINILESLNNVSYTLLCIPLSLLIILISLPIIIFIKRFRILNKLLLGGR